MSTQTEPIPETLDETAVRADTLFALLTARFVDWSHCNGAMRVLGLSKEDMSAAKMRRSYDRMGVDIPTPAKDDDQPPARPFRRRDVKPFKAPSVPRPVRAVPHAEEPQLRCSQCREWKPADAFSLRTDRPGSGTRRSACKDCYRAAGRRRYLNVEALGTLGKVGLDFIVEDGDQAAKLVCAKCRKPINPGEDATVTGEVGHVECPKGESP